MNNAITTTAPNGMRITLSPAFDSRISKVETDATMGTVVYAKTQRAAGELSREARAWGVSNEFSVAVG